MNYELITDYKHNAIYRKSFFELVQTTFELDFKQWDDAGGWNDNYRCLSYRLGSQIVANVSINELTVIVEGNAHSALQIGTVVTHPDHRNKGLSRQLIEYALTTYEKDYDFIYLFANDTVLSFYPKFGFKQWHESTFVLDVSTYKKSKNTNSWRKLTREVPADLEIMTRLAEQRKPLSNQVEVTGREHLSHFYYILGFGDALYYHSECDALLIFEIDGSELHLFDIIAAQPINLNDILSSLLTSEITTVNFYFTPDGLPHVQSARMENPEDTLFVRSKIEEPNTPFVFPLTSHA